MLTIRKSSERGHFNHGWLDTYHTFSFGEYYDNRFLGFRDLRVINDDVIAEGVGFPTHSHRDMEILTYMLDGEIEHKDSMGTGSVIKVGDIQYMSAGTGVNHSEFNPSEKNPSHLLQIWILPKLRGVPPCYAQKHFAKETRLNQLRLIASGDGREGSVEIRQDISLYASVLEPKQKLEFALSENRFGWLQLAKGNLEMNGEKLEAGDGVAIAKESILRFSTSESPAEFLLFDLA
jgi:redox-sensitive bicupin YhaK (pirin superfamily)